MCKKSKRTSRIAIRCFPCEETLIREKAAMCSLSVSRYLISCALKKNIQQKTDHKMINELRKLGGLQKHLFFEGGEDYANNYNEILNEIKQAIIRISK